MKCVTNHSDPDILNQNDGVNNHLVYLQVVGKSQLLKELEETQNVTHKYIHEEALHRNEETCSVEGNYEDQEALVISKTNGCGQSKDRYKPSTEANKTRSGTCNTPQSQISSKMQSIIEKNLNGMHVKKKESGDRTKESLGHNSTISISSITKKDRLKTAQNRIKINVHELRTKAFDEIIESNMDAKYFYY